MDRRRFLGMSLFSLGALSATVKTLFSSSQAMAAGKCEVPTGANAADPTKAPGKTFNYVVDANTSKHAKYKAGDNCKGCKFYLGQGDTAPCTMMQKKLVSGCGWCQLYAKKS